MPELDGEPGGCPTVSGGAQDGGLPQLDAGPSRLAAAGGVALEGRTEGHQPRASPPVGTARSARSVRSARSARQPTGDDGPGAPLVLLFIHCS